MDYTDILVEKSDHIAVVTINRPEKLNATRVQTVLEMMDALDEIDRDENVYSVILTGKGRSFSSGADTAELPEVDMEKGLLSRNSPFRVYSDLGKKLLHLHQPVVAAINGWCVGGGLGMALCCDILIAGEDAVFYVPEIKYGYPSMPGSGVLLFRFISPSLAKDIILCRRQIDAATAAGMGLVSRVVPGDRLMDEAWEVARLLAEVPPEIMTMEREMMNSIWLGAAGIESAMSSGSHTAIAGHAHSGWQKPMTEWKSTLREDNARQNP